MKSIAASLVLLAFLIGCTTPQQTQSYKTLYSLEVGVTSAYDGYCHSVISGLSRTNDLPHVSHAYNNFQSAALVALDGVQRNTNAITPPALLIIGQDVINLIVTVKGKK